MNKKVITFMSLVVSLLSQNANSSSSNVFGVMTYSQEKQIMLMQTSGEERLLLLKAFSVSDINELTAEEKNKSLQILEKVKNRLEVESTPYVMD